MRRLLLALLCLLLAFYVGWPLWSALQLRNALKAEDAETVARKIDFPSVRASMRPAVEQKASQTFDAYAKQIGPGGALILSQLRPQVLPKLVESALDALVTPQNVIRIANDQGPVNERIERILREQLGRIPGVGRAEAGAGGGSGGGNLPGGFSLPGGMGQIAGQLGLGSGSAGVQAGPASGAPAGQSPQAAAKGAGREFGLGNIKRFAFSGPLGFEVAVAKDRAAQNADLVARMGFSGFDWKLVGLVPNIR